MECIPETSILDGLTNCGDGSDEIVEYHVGRRSCPEDYYMCADNAKCIEMKYVCDGISGASDMRRGCKDGTDEGSNCESWECLPDYFKCSDNRQCIEAKYVCTTNRQSPTYTPCLDKSNEHNQLCGCPNESDWPCVDGDGCVSEEAVCDGIPQCNDASDEHIDMCLHWNCSHNMGKCLDNKQCVSLPSVCDGKNQCYDGSDEKVCVSFSCPNGSQKCADGLQCIKDSKICDGDIDCFDASDELCTASCLQIQVQEKRIIRRCTEDPKTCVPIERYCNRVADCPLGSDEAGCSCKDWGMHQCQIHGDFICVYKEWLSNNESGDCFTELNKKTQFKDQSSASSENRSDFKGKELKMDSLDCFLSCWVLLR